MWYLIVSIPDLAPLLSNEVLYKLKYIGFHVSGVSTYELSTLITSLPHILMKENFFYLIEQTFTRKVFFIFLNCNEKNITCFTSKDHKHFKL